MRVIRGFAVITIAVAASAGSIGSGTALATAGGGGCQLQGGAKFVQAPGDNATGPGDSPSATWSYNFTGSLSGCESSPGASFAPSSGSVSAGQPLTFVDQNKSDTTFGETVTATPALPSGSGSCGSSTTSGIAFINWGGTDETILQYSTTGAGPLVGLNGTSYATSDGTRASYQFPVQTVTVGGSGVAGQSPIMDATQFAAAGDGGVGALSFQPPTPTDCATSTGVSTAGIMGFVGLGSSS